MQINNLGQFENKGSEMEKKKSALSIDLYDA